MVQRTHMRACTGFDGDFERGAAIRGSRPRKNSKSKYKR